VIARSATTLLRKTTIEFPSIRADAVGRREAQLAGGRLEHLEVLDPIALKQATLCLID
jgi:hypothetical protein